MIAVAYIQRHAVISVRFDRIRKPTTVPTSAPIAWKAKALSTSLPRSLLAMLSEITRCAVG